MKKIFVLALCFILSSCCSTEKYKALLDSRLGMSENELIQQIGNPTSVYDTNEKRSLEYTFKNFFCNQYGCYTHWCTTQYTIKNGKVDYWRYNGNKCCI